MKLISHLTTSIILCLITNVTSADNLSSDMGTLKACLGVGMLSKEAGELRDRGMSAQEVGKALSNKLTQGDSSKEEAAIKITSLPISLAFNNKELHPWTLHSLGTKICVFSTKADLSKKTLDVMAQWALACQEQYKEPKLINGCMSELDGLLSKY
jgi:hypothetical protein